MRNSRVVPPDHRHFLAEVIDHFFGSQATLAEEVGIAQGTVSNALHGKKVGCDKLLKIVQALQRKSAAGGMDVLGELDCLEKLFEGDSKVLPKLYRGGGVLPLSAGNRLVPSPRIFECVFTRAPTSIIIEGPVMSGKSTMALAICERARASAYRVVHFDCGLWSGLSSFPFFSCLAEMIGKETGISLPCVPITSHLDFRCWFINARRGNAASPLLIVIDHVEEVMDGSVAHALYNLAVVLSGWRDILNFSWLIVFSTGVPTTEIARLQKDSVFDYLHTGLFSPAEVTELAERWNVQKLPLSDLLERLEGQPFLTQTIMAAVADDGGLHTPRGKETVSRGIRLFCNRIKLWGGVYAPVSDLSISHSLRLLLYGSEIGHGHRGGLERLVLSHLPR